VHWVTGGKPALRFLKTQTPTLILLDVKLDVSMDAGTFLRRARAQAPSTRAPVVLLTALREIHALQDELGADAAIAKPFDLDTLFDVIQRYAPLNASK
jgi:CheY-like chemotaxis protein